MSLSYRVVFRRDPIAEDSTKNPFHTLKHVHGAVYISDDSMQPGTQPKRQLARADMRDHTAEAYSGALNQTCSRSMHRESAVGRSQGWVGPPSPLPNPSHLAILFLHLLLAVLSTASSTPVSFCTRSLPPSPRSSPYHVLPCHLTDCLLLCSSACKLAAVPSIHPPVTPPLPSPPGSPPLP